MRQPRLALLHFDHARMPNESAYCMLFPPYLATHDTNFHSCMVVIHPALFRAWLCIEGWYEIVVEKSL